MIIAFGLLRLKWLACLSLPYLVAKVFMSSLCAFCSRCTAIAWVPGGDGFFLAAHADGNLYFYHKVFLIAI
jgi:hypothetical protein